MSRRLALVLVVTLALAAFLAPPTPVAAAQEKPTLKTTAAVAR